MKYLVPAFIIGIVGGLLDEVTSLHKVWCFLIGVGAFFLFVFIKSVIVTIRYRREWKQGKANKILFALLLSLCCATAYADNHSWVEANHSEDYSTWAFVYDDISKPQLRNGYYKVWVKYEYNTAEARKAHGLDAKEIIELLEVSCDMTKYRVLQSIDYDTKGRVVRTEDVPTNWKYFIPDTVGSKIAETINDILASDE